MSRMRIIRASEINSFLYCERAWWYHLQGFPSANQSDLEQGQLAHRFHTRQVQRAIWKLRIAYLLLFLAAVFLLWHLIG
ncbi:MAG: hypothetical protein ACK44E_10155 [Anaerolineales bacterium]